MSKVYLLFQTRIFQEAVQAILSTHPAIELVGAATEISQALEEIAVCHPDVIFLEQSLIEGATGDLTALLNSRTPSRLILLRLDGDEISIWSPSRLRSVHARDLLAAVLESETCQVDDRNSPGIADEAARPPGRSGNE